MPTTQAPHQTLASHRLSSAKYAGLAIASAATFAAYGLSVQACGGDDAGNPDAAVDASDGGQETGPGGGTAQPPPRPNAPATTSTTEHNFAMKEVFLGDTDTMFTKASTAWQSFGFNIDGKVTTKDSTDVCTSTSGGSAHANPPNGLDNAFGAHVLPFLALAAPMGLSRQLSDSIQHGTFTVQFDVTGLTMDATQTNTGLSAKVYSGLLFDPATCAAPTFTTADVWPVDPSMLSNPMDVKTAKIAFKDAYIVNGLWVNGSPGDIDLTISVLGIPLHLTIHKAQVTFQRNGSHLTQGLIGGVLSADEFVASLAAAAAAIPSLGGAIGAVVPSIRAASDILTDGTNQAGKMCDGISIGLGFNAEEIAPPSKIGDPSVIACGSDGGTEGGTNDSGTDGGNGGDSGDGG
jgi:hypothetical protein